MNNTDKSPSSAPIIYAILSAGAAAVAVCVLSVDHDRQAAHVRRVTDDGLPFGPTYCVPGEDLADHPDDFDDLPDADQPAPPSPPTDPIITEPTTDDPPPTPDPGQSADPAPDTTVPPTPDPTPDTAAQPNADAPDAAPVPEPTSEPAPDAKRKSGAA